MKKNGASFENKLSELENIVSELETGNVPIEEMFTLYEKGQKLYGECNDILTAFEKRLDGAEKNEELC